MSKTGVCPVCESWKVKDGPKPVEPTPEPEQELEEQESGPDPELVDRGKPESYRLFG